MFTAEEENKDEDGRSKVQKADLSDGQDVEMESAGDRSSETFFVFC